MSNKHFKKDEIQIKDWLFAFGDIKYKTKTDSVENWQQHHESRCLDMPAEQTNIIEQINDRQLS